MPVAQDQEPKTGLRESSPVLSRPKAVVWSEPRQGRWGRWEAWLQEAAARLNKYEMQATLSGFSYPFHLAVTQALPKESHSHIN